MAGTTRLRIGGKREKGEMGKRKAKESVQNFFSLFPLSPFRLFPLAHKETSVCSCVPQSG